MASIITLRAMNLARAYSINASRSLDDTMSGGCGTAVRQLMRHSYGIHEFLIERGVRNPERAIRLRRSHGPITQDAGLELAAHRAFNQTYLGDVATLQFPDGGITDFRLIRTDIYTQLGTGRVGLSQKIENFPVPEYGTVADVPPRLPGVQIGCPITLTPRQTGALWGAFVDSAAQIGLV